MRFTGPRVRLFAYVSSLALVASFALAQGIHASAALDLKVDPPGRPMRLPTDVALLPDGRILVADGAHDRIVRFQRDGEFDGVLELPAEEVLHEPVGLHVDRDGSIWIADSGGGSLLCASADGRTTRIQLPTAADGSHCDPTSMAFGAESVLWVVDNDGHRLLQREKPADPWREIGGLGEALGQFQYPFKIVAGRSGNLYVSDVINARICVIDAAGNALRVIGRFGVETGHLYRPGGLALDADENVWVADSVMSVVQVFRPDGGFIDFVRADDGAAQRFSSPLGMAFDAAGDLYVVESAANRVRKFTVGKSARVIPIPSPPLPSVLSGQQAKACTICHVDWITPFSEGRDTQLMRRPAARPDDPVAARAEICLSCHDGTVADSRRKVWDEHGHRTGNEPPSHMSVPSHLPLIDGKLACRTCHSAHGPGASQGDFRRAVLLRVANPTGELCVSCHAEKTGGPRFGTHPTGGMPWAIPEELVRAGAKVGPNPRELTCQVCHTPHGARYDHLLVMGVSSNQLCMTCHDQIRPGMFRAGEHMEHPMTAKLDSSQLAAVHKLGTRAGPENQLVCLSCHKLHHGAGGRFLLAADLADGEMCLSCHEQRRHMLGSPHDLRTNFPQERNRLGLTVSDTGPCSACHLFHRYARTQTPGPGDQPGFCINCHSESGCAKGRPLGAALHPSERCTECHNPHDPQFGHFLKRPGPELCSACHQEQRALIGGPHDARAASDAWCAISDRIGDPCLSCHNPHGDDSYAILRRPTPHADDGCSGNSACLACHADLSSLGGQPFLLNHPQKIDPAHTPAGAHRSRTTSEMQMGCNSCHDPHAGGAPAPMLLRTDGSTDAAQLCLECHVDMRQVVHSAHGTQSLSQAGLQGVACGPCHEIHDRSDPIRQARTASTQIGGGAASTGAAEDDVVCRTCHRDSGPARPPTVATHPAVPLFAPAGGDTVLPLFAGFGRPDPQGRITCLTCHLPHGRPAHSANGDSVSPNAHTLIEVAPPRLLRSFEPPNTCTSCHGPDGLRRFLYFHDPDRRGPNNVELLP